jgi:uncharacterized protein YvpB
MADEERPVKDAEKYWVQPASGVKFIHKEPLSGKQLETAMKRVRKGEPVEIVAADFAARIKERELK